MADKKITRAPIKNPFRKPGQITEEEKEVLHIHKKGIKQEKEVFRKKTYEYRAPFNYPNVKVELGRPDTGCEFNMDGVELDVPPFGAITIVENEPIIAVDVIGSACVPPGYIFLQGEPLEWKYPRTAVKMKKGNLWGSHIIWDLWKKGVDEEYREAGLSSAHFEIPDCKKVTLMGGSELDPHFLPKPDFHYCFRIIRITVKENE